MQMCTVSRCKQKTLKEVTMEIIWSWWWRGSHLKYHKLSVNAPKPLLLPLLAMYWIASCRQQGVDSIIVFYINMQRTALTSGVRQMWRESGPLRYWSDSLFISDNKPLIRFAGEHVLQYSQQSNDSHAKIFPVSIQDKDLIQLATLNNAAYD